MGQIHQRADGARTVTCRTDRRRAHLGVYARGGSRFETSANQGLSHFLEHMLFRGCDALPGPHAVALAFEKLGASFEGATMVDATMLTVDCPAANVHAVARVLADVLRAPSFGGIETERGIVLEELLEDVDENGRSVNADDLLRARLFGAHPLALPIAGTGAAVATFGEQDVREIYPRTFSRASAVTACAGPLAEAELRAIADLLADALPSGTPLQTALWSGPAGQGFEDVKTDDSQCELRLGFLTPGAGHPDREAFELLMRIIDDGMSTRLYSRICNELGLCYDTQASHDTHHEVGVFSLSGRIAPERAPELVREWSLMLTELAQGRIRDEEVIDAKARTHWDADALLESPSSLLEHEALETLWGLPTDMSAWRAKVDALTPDAIRRVAREVFVPGTAAMVSVGPSTPKRHDKLVAAAAPWLGR